MLTDARGVPRAWKGIQVPSEEVSPEGLEALSAGRPVPDEVRKKVEIVRAAVEGMDKRHPPISMVPPGGGESLGLVHWGDPPGLDQLRFLPYIELVVMLLFVGLAAWGARSIKTSEQRAIWIGLAKETAHQLGTPISSLLGWVELLRERQLDAAAAGDPAAVDPEFLSEVLDEMENDAERLQKVAMRFGQVGSLPKLEMGDIAPIVSEAVRYFRRRIPHLGKDVEIRERYELVPPVSLPRADRMGGGERAGQRHERGRRRGQTRHERDPLQRRRETESVEV